MRVIEIIVDIGVDDIDRSREFYERFLGLTVEDLGLDWVRRYVSAETGAQIQLVTRDATAPESPRMTVKVDDVIQAHAEAQERGYEIIHPLTTEPWGITRFFVRAPDGTAINIAQHRPVDEAE